MPLIAGVSIKGVNKNQKWKRKTSCRKSKFYDWVKSKDQSLTSPHA